MATKHCPELVEGRLGFSGPPVELGAIPFLDRTSKKGTWTKETSAAFSSVKMKKLIKSGTRRNS